MSAAEAEDGANGAVEENDDEVVDLGILDATASDDNAREEELPAANPSNRGDVWECLYYENHTGSCCASDKADGTTLTPALPSILGLRVTGVGDLPLPLSDWHAKTLKGNRNTVKINNGSYHKTYTVDSARVRIKNPVWKASLEKLVQTVAYKLGVDPTKLTAELHSLLYMEKGSHVERCKTTDEGGNVLGTLFVQLPSVFTGGKISIFNAGETEDGAEEKNEEETSTFQLGASGDASFACHFVCHYKDCEYEIAKIKSGSRVLLRYSLHYKLDKKQEEELPIVSSLNTSMSTLKWSLENLPPVDKMMLISTEKEFHASTIEVHGINALSYKQRRSVEAIKAAVGEGWKLLVVNAEMVKKKETHYYDSSITTNSSILQIFDEEGNDVTEAEKWLKDVVDFDSAIDGDNDTGMVLDFENEYGENDWWGECKNTEKRNRTTTEHYRASFILAYDSTLSESELKCLSGIEGVSEVAEKVVSTKDYNLFERLLTVVESKDKCKFDIQSVHKLLQMLTRSRSKNALSSDRIVLVNKTLSGLSPSLEPDDELFNMIISAVEKFGHDNITTGISAMLNDQARLKGHKLSVFLHRVEFILTLNKRLENGTSYLEKSISDLSSSGGYKLGIASDVLNKTIVSMITEHGWDKMKSVAEAILTFLHKKVATNKSINTLLNRICLISKLVYKYPCDFHMSCLKDFAEDFALCLSSSGRYTTMSMLKGDNQNLFVAAIIYTLKHGTVNDLTQVGKWAIGSKDSLTTLLDAIPAQSRALRNNSNVLLRDILNKCLVQNTTTRSGWNDRREDGTVDPSLHIQLVLEKHPNLPRMVDKDGRITLHHAAATSTDPSSNRRAPYETIQLISKAYPEGVSIRDPVTRLYPFMLSAGSQTTGGVHSNSNNASASFTLLLANPSLVMSGIQEEVENADGRKRKRSASMG